MWVTRADLARLAGVSIARIDQLREEYGHQCEHGDKQKTRIYAPAWLELRRESQKQSTDLGHAERLKKAQADIAEENLKKLRGELVSRQEIESEYRMVGQALRSLIEQLDARSQDVIREGLKELEQFSQQQEINGNGSGKQSGSKKPVARAGAKRPTQKGSDKSRVRGKVRQAAAN